MTEEIKIYRGKYCFVGPKAEESAKYFDTVLSFGYSGDMDWLAADAAHKFSGQAMTDGAVFSGRTMYIGEKAVEAAAFFLEEYQKTYAACKKVCRRNAMIDKTHDLCREVKKRFHVEIKEF